MDVTRLAEALRAARGGDATPQGPRMHGKSAPRPGMQLEQPDIGSVIAQMFGLGGHPQPAPTPGPIGGGVGNTGDWQGMGSGFNNQQQKSEMIEYLMGMING